jgi:hypothetical protein
MSGWAGAPILLALLVQVAAAVVVLAGRDGRESAT